MGTTTSSMEFYVEYSRAFHAAEVYTIDFNIALVLASTVREKPYLIYSHSTTITIRSSRSSREVPVQMSGARRQRVKRLEFRECELLLA